MSEFEDQLLHKHRCRVKWRKYLKININILLIIKKFTFFPLRLKFKMIYFYNYLDLLPLRTKVDLIGILQLFRIPAPPLNKSFKLKISLQNILYLLIYSYKNSELNITLKHTKRENGIVKTTTTHESPTRIFPHVVASSVLALSAEKVVNISKVTSAFNTLIKF